MDPLVTSFKLETMCSPTLQACQTEETEIKEISMARESPSYQTAETTDTHRDESSSAAKVSSSTQAGKHLHVIIAFIGLICSTGTSSIVNHYCSQIYFKTELILMTQSCHVKSLTKVIV